MSSLSSDAQPTVSEALKAKTLNNNNNIYNRMHEMKKYTTPTTENMTESKT